MKKGLMRRKSNVKSDRVVKDEEREVEREDEGGKCYRKGD